MHPLTRRDFLRRGAGLGILGAGALASGSGLAAVSSVLRPGVAAAAVPAPFSRALPIPQVLTDANISLVAREADVQILDGAPTRMWTFNGTFPGPTIRRPSGQTTTVTVQHSLPPAPPIAGGEDTLTIHHHGSHSASEHDGLPLPEVAIQPGASRTYVYEHMEDGEPERAAMQWYHDHTHHRTSFNSYMGLAGFFILDDAVEAALPLPRGAYEIPLFLTDRSFDDNNQLDLSQFSASHSAREINGETTLVNGAVQPYIDVEPRRYRLRVHNGAHFVLFNLKLAQTASSQPTDAAAAPAVPLTQIGTESGLLPASVDRTHVVLGPAERADLIVDLSGFAGQSLVLATVSGRDRSRSIAGTPPLPPAQAQGPLGTDADYPAVLLQLRVGMTVSEPDPGSPPAILRPRPDWVSSLPQQPSRVFVFGNGVDETNPSSLPHTINGRPFNHTRVDATPALGSVETWLLLNASLKTHYIHLHDVDWYVVSRNGAPPAPYEAGLKETFRLDHGEFVVIGTKFTDHLGPFMLHCHMLDHEDSGMMARFDVVAAGQEEATTLTADEQRRTDTILAAMRANPGQPAPLALLQSLERTVRVSNDGSPYRCTLV